MKTGVFIHGAGNRTFFAKGILWILFQEKIYLDTLIGFSAASAIIFSHILGYHTEGLELFSKALQKNKRNWYPFSKEQFPHNRIYKDTIREMLERYDRKSNTSKFTILAGAVPSKKMNRCKSLLATIAMACDIIFGWDFLLPVFRKIFRVKTITIDEKSCLRKKKLLRYFMGSSTIYPLIKPHVFRGNLLIDGVMVESNPKELLAGFDKKIIIHADNNGTTGVVDDIFHIYMETVANLYDTLDYTDPSKIKTFHTQGERVMRENLGKLKDFLNN